MQAIPVWYLVDPREQGVGHAHAHFAQQKKMRMGTTEADLEAVGVEAALAVLACDFLGHHVPAGPCPCACA